MKQEHSSNTIAMSICLIVAAFIFEEGKQGHLSDI